MQSMTATTKYKAMLHNDINNIQCHQDAIQFLKGFSVHEIKQFLHQGIEIKNNHRSLAFHSLCINKIIPIDVFINCILPFLPLLLYSCKVRLVNKNWNRMYHHCVKMHYLQLNKEFEKYEVNPYDTKINNTWIIYNTLSKSKTKLNKVEQDLNFKIFQKGTTKINGGDRIILFPWIYNGNDTYQATSIFLIKKDLSIIGIYPNTTLKVIPTNYSIKNIFTLAPIENNLILNILIKNIKVEGIRVDKFFIANSSVNLTISNCNINYKHRGIIMSNSQSSLIVTDTYFHGYGPCFQISVRNSCSINIRDCQCLVDYGVLHLWKGSTTKPFILGPTTNFELSFIGHIAGGCLAILNADENQCKNDNLILFCKGNVFVSDIYPVGTTNKMTYSNINQKFENNKWKFYKPMVLRSYVPNLMCSSSKCGSRKCINSPDTMVSMIKDNHEMCEGCGERVHTSCLYQYTPFINYGKVQKPKLCYICYIQQIQKYDDQEKEIDHIQTKYDIFNDICKHDFHQKSVNQVNRIHKVEQCCKCNHIFHQNQVIWKCGQLNDGINDYTSYQQKTNWYCHMTLCQTCYHTNFQLD